MAIDLELFDEYLNGENSPLFKRQSDLTNKELTERKVDGCGTFDVLMSSVHAHILTEFQKNRITGSEYAKAYTAMTEAVMSNSVQYLLQKENAYWQAVNGQMQALTARVNVDLAIKELELKTAEIAIREKELFIKIKELDLMEKQIALTHAQKLEIDQNIINKEKEALVLDAQKLLVKEQMEAQRAQTMDTRSDGVTLVSGNIKAEVNIKNAQKLEIDQNVINKTKEALVLDEQRKLVKEQTESQLAQTLDVRTDSAAVSGLIKTQKDLYKQQIDSYKRDAETKVGKLLIDTWTTQKTVDEGLTAPTQVSNANLDTLIAALRSRNTI